MPFFQKFTFAALFFLLAVQPCYARHPAPCPADLLAGETMQYTINFWLLKGSAKGELCFFKSPGGYTSYFEAETRGILRIIAGHRKETMESVMEFDEALQRLRPRRFTEAFRHKGRTFTRRIDFDHERGRFTCTRTGPQGSRKVTMTDLPDTDFEDMLTLYYNLRMGCYGPLPTEEKIRAQVLMKESPSFITIAFPAAEANEHMQGFPAILAMERNITHAFSKRVLISLSPEVLLEKALVVDAFFFGDLEVKLTGINYH